MQASPLQIFLIGYRAVGKTTVGEAVARRLSLDFVDTDRRIVEEAGITIREIFESRGEAGFRILESQALRGVIEETRDRGAVIATGGGIILDPTNVDLLRESGRVFWLRARVDTIRGRLEEDASTGESRPGLTGSSAIDEVQSVLRERVPRYREAAHHALDTDPPATIDSIVEALIAHLPAPAEGDPGPGS